jgi:hypothetical protein
MKKPQQLTVSSSDPQGLSFVRLEKFAQFFERSRSVESLWERKS